MVPVVGAMHPLAQLGSDVDDRNSGGFEPVPKAGERAVAQGDGAILALG